jgi:hypothetical protein
MVRIPWIHRIQGCGAINPRDRKRAPPLIVIPTALSVPPCSELSRYGLAKVEGVERLVRRPTLTAPARVGFSNTAGRGEDTGFQIKQRNTDQERKKEKDGRSETA